MPEYVAPTHFNNYNAYLRMRFGGRVGKISLDLGIPCPHRREHPPGCMYCRPGVIMSDRIGEQGSITNQIYAGVQKVGARYKAEVFLAYFQNETSTAGEMQWLMERYDEAFLHPKVSAVIISTRPDCVDDALLDRLYSKGWRKPVFLELGLQSAHDETLKRINRGHDFATFEKAVRAAHRRKILVGAHLILGLPGETHDMMVDTFRTVAGLPVDSIKIHHLQIYQKAPMEMPWRQGEIQSFKSFDEYLELLLDCLEVLPWRVKIQRLVADSPSVHLLAPDFGMTKNDIIARVEESFAARGTKQGSKANPKHNNIALL